MGELERTGGTPTVAAWDYAPAPESRDVVSFAERYGLYIGGELVDPLSGEWFTTASPATEEPLAEIAQAGAADVDAAVGAARAAFEGAGRRRGRRSGRS